MNNPELSAEWRAKPNTAEFLIKTVNHQILQSSNINNAQTTASSQGVTGAQNTHKRWIRAAKMLQNGDVFLYAWDVRTAETLIHWKEDWIRCLGKDARVQLPTYGMVVSDIPADANMDNQGAMKEQFWRENDYLPVHGDITRIRWLGKKKEGRNTNAMVVEFEDIRVANGLLMTGTVTWNGQPKKTQRYSRDCIITQCFNCHHYGHLSKKCNAKEVCGYCNSKEHKTKEHPNPKDRTKYKCALCGGKHAAWSAACTKRKAVLEKIAKGKKELLENPFFPEELDITPGVSECSTRVNSESGSNHRQHRQETEEVIEVDMGDVDELATDGPQSSQASEVMHNIPPAPEAGNRPGPQKGLGTGINSSIFRSTPGLNSSEFNFDLHPQTPGSRAFADRLQGSSPLPQSASTAMPPPRRFKDIGRKRKLLLSSANTTLIGTPRTPLGIIDSNRRTTTIALSTGATKTVFASDSEHTDNEATQGYPKRVRSEEMDIDAIYVPPPSSPPAFEEQDVLQPCKTITVYMDREEETAAESAAESAANGGSELSRGSSKTKSSGSSSSSSGAERVTTRQKRNTKSTSHE